MTSYSSSVPQSTSETYLHPWYIALRRLGSITTLELGSMPKQKLETTGRRYTNCKNCGYETREPDWDSKRNEYRHYTECNACRNFKRRHNFVLTEDDRNFLESNRECQICNSTKKLHIDHCHSTNIIRGYLCETCNRGLGYFHDDISKLTNAINYIKNVQQEKQD